MRTDLALKFSLMYALLAILTIAFWCPASFAGETCYQKLSTMTMSINSVLGGDTADAAKKVTEIYKNNLPIEQCEQKEFEDIARKSPYFRALYEESSYVVATFRRYGVELGIVFDKIGGRIKDGYAKVIF